jgi:hypothetical protein
VNAKQQFADVFSRENATTRNVIRSLPEGKAEFQPFANAKSARELAFIFSLGQGGIAAALSNQWQWPPQRPQAPATYTKVLTAFDATTAAVKDALSKAPDSRLDEKVPSIYGPSADEPWM